LKGQAITGVTGRMTQTKHAFIALMSAMLIACSATLAATTASPNDRSRISEPVLVEVEKLGDRGAAYGAAKKLAEEGGAIVPELIIALEHTLNELSTYDPYNLGDAKDDYSALLYRQAQLMGLIGASGGAEDADRLISMAGLMRSENIVAASYFETLDSLGAREKADALATQIIADPDSDNIKLFVAMLRYSQRTPAEIAHFAEQHLDKDLLLVKGTAYRLLINAGRGHEVRDRLIEDVDKLEYTGNGNHSMLQALALIEEPETFEPRIGRLRLRSNVKEAATLTNRFAWSSDDRRLAMLSSMLDSSYADVSALAIGFMLENGRVDLLKEHHLVSGAMRQFEYYEAIVPGFAEMSRDRLLRHMSTEEVAATIRQKSQPLAPIISTKMRSALQRLGYRLEKRDGKIVIIPPGDGS
jgi:hypothetical protein